MNLIKKIDNSIKCFFIFIFFFRKDFLWGKLDFSLEEKEKLQPDQKIYLYWLIFNYKISSRY
jgi:hypothetical protein